MRARRLSAPYALKLALRALAGAAMAVALGASADEIRLANGDRISGAVLAKAGGKLVVRTGYAGEIEIDWHEVQSVSSDAPLLVLLAGEALPLRAKLRRAADGRAILETPDGKTREIRLREIAFLNPKPHESGAGISYSGRAALSAAYASGNTESERVHGDAELTARGRAHRTQISGRIERRLERPAAPVSAWRGGASHDRFLDPARFVYVRGSLEHDRAKDLARRATGGFGYGVELLDTARSSLSLRGGLDYVVEERYAAPDQRYPALGWGLKASHFPWGPRLQLFHEHEGFRNLEASEIVLRSKSGVRMPIAAGMSAAAQLSLDWESRPAPGRASTDAALLLGLDYAW
jgi:putative salt-induced outer membrane protein YdiY